MATARRPSSFHDIRGKIGDLVYKWYGKRLVITRAPRASTKRASVKQRGGRGRFAKASRYAEQVRDDPAVWPLYVAAAKKKLIPTRAMAIYDYLAKPKFSGVSLDLCYGEKGGTIAIFLADRHAFKTTAVAVALHGPEGKLLERGPAEDHGRGVWHYVTRTDIPAKTPLTLRAEATDRFGKTTTAAWTAMPGAKTCTRIEG